LNPNVTDPDGLSRIWTSAQAVYYPLSSTVFWLVYQLWGANPFPFHLINVLLHIFNVLLLWRLLTHLRIPGAWLAAAIFGLHPVVVESVAWITELKNLLAAFFFLLASLAYLQFDSKEKNEPRIWAWYGATVLFFMLSLLAKPAAIMFPVLLILYAWWKNHP